MAPTGRANLPETAKRSDSIDFRLQDQLTALDHASIMSQQLTIAFILFAVVAAFTPGPNNTMLLASGLNFGFRRTIPHVLGVAFGLGVVVLVAGFGLGAVFRAYPTLY